MSNLLFKVAKDLNVGTSTIVEHLKKKGLEIDNKPNAKLSDEMLSELSKQFQSSKVEKEKADLISIGNRPKPVMPVIDMVKKDRPTLQILQNREPVATAPSAPTIPTPPSKAIEEAPVVVEKKETSAPTPPAELEQSPRERVQLAGPKVLGRINLDNINKPKPQAPAAKPAPRAEQPKPKQQEPKLAPAPRAEQPKQTPPKAEQAPVVAAPVSTDPSTTEAPTPATGGIDNFRAETPQLKGLKILGKINTDQFERAKKKDVRGNTPPGAPRPAGSPDDPKKKKRKRKKVTSTQVTEESIKKIGTGVGQPGGGQNRPGGGQNRPAGTGYQGGQGGGQNRPAGTGYQGGQNRPAGGGYQGGQGGGQNRPAGTGGPGGQNRPAGGGYQGGQNRPGGGQNRGGQGGGFVRREEPKEISKKEIDDQIKATMARLNVGGKNKRQKIRRGNREDKRERQEQLEGEVDNKLLQLTEFVTVSELASLMDVPVTNVIMTCMNLGVIVSINQRLDAEVIEIITSEFGFETQFISAEDQLEVIEEIPDTPESLKPRAPIVTVMGHVDHGKTSLLDNIRKASVASGEAGGITQHIGAYEVKLDNGKRITFLDTPGHEAFTAMRARGAKVTDVAVIIISADDSIMPQTREAISHAQAASVPMIFAINKIDKAGADPERIKADLANMNLLVEDWGGKYQSQDISAKKGLNIDKLLEKILLEAEILDLHANPDKGAIGTVIEASMEKGRGYVMKALIQEGTLREGDPIVAGEHAAKIRAMFNEKGQRVKTAGPSTPVLILGLSGAPQAGEKFKVMESETEARQLASKRSQIAREQANRANKRISLDEIGRRLALGTFKELNLIIKGDVDGSVEALADALIKLSIERVQVRVIHQAVGQIIDSDVLLATASDAIIVGFQVRPSLTARKIADREGVEIKQYSVIYEAIDEIKAAIEGMLEPTKEEKVTATVEVREVYKISKIGSVAGCFVQDGKILRNHFIRVIRDGIVVFPIKEGAKGELASLKRFRDDVKEVRNMMECGITIKGFNDIEVGDTIESYEIIEVKAKL